MPMLSGKASRPPGGDPLQRSAAVQESTLRLGRLKSSDPSIQARWPLRVSVLVIFERVIVALQWRAIPERSDGVLRA